MQAPPVCDPLAELRKLTDASDTVTLLYGLGIISPANLPSQGLAFYLPSNKAMAMLAKQFPTSSTKPGVQGFMESWASLPPAVQQKVISVLLYHVTPNTALPGELPTGLTVLNPGKYTLTVSKDGTEVVSAVKQQVVRGPAYPICGDVAYIISQVLMPTDALSIPNTPAENALQAVTHLATIPAATTAG